MDTYFGSFFLGLVQGLTEFLPVSSSAHLVLVPYFFDFPDPGLAFDVALHLGTLAAILICFYKDWILLIQDFFKRPKKSDDIVSFKTLVFATVPAAIAGLFLEHLAETTFRNPLLIAFTLSLCGALLLYADRKGKKYFSLKDLEKMPRKSLLIGCAQALALVPGVSRSGITITIGLLLGLSRSAALRFSFLLSAPIIAGAGVLKAKYIYLILKQGGIPAHQVLIGLTSSFFFGILAIELLRKLVEKRTFEVFSYYRFILSLIIVVVVIIR